MKTPTTHDSVRVRGQLLHVADDGSGIVELDAGAACARCARGRGCGAMSLAPAGAPARLRCLPCGPLRPGTPVDVDAPAGAGWLAPVFLAYGLPTLGLLAGSLAPEPWAPLGAIVGLGGGLLAWRGTNARLERTADAGPCSLVARTRPVDEGDDDASGQGAMPVVDRKVEPANLSLPREEQHA